MSETFAEINQMLDRIKDTVLRSAGAPYHLINPNAIKPTKYILIDQINAGVRDALMALSDLLREEGDDVGADCFLWCWRMGRWPIFSNAVNFDYPHSVNAWQFNGVRVDQAEHGLGNIRSWFENQECPMPFVFATTAAKTIFGAFSNFLEKMWRKSPDHVAQLMKDL